MNPALPDYYFAPSVTAQTFASVPRRAFASILDSLLMVVGFCALIAVFQGAITSENESLFLMVLAMFPWMYKIGFETSGATLGKKALNIRVVDEQGGAPGLKRAMKRSFLPIVLSYSAVLGQISFAFADDVVLVLMISMIVFLISTAVSLLDVLWAIWDERKQALRDKIDGTFVIRD